MLPALLRRYSLKKAASPVPTGILPLGALQSAIVLIDVTAPDFETCKNTVLMELRKRNIRPEVFFFDFRPLDKGERLITSVSNTILRKDLNWYGLPCQEKLDWARNLNPDLFLSLLPEPGFQMEMLVRNSPARFKVGRQQLPGKVFDLVVMDPESGPLTQTQAFQAILNLLETIR